MKTVSLVVFIIVSSSFSYSANVYFTYPLNGDFISFNTSGYATINYHVTVLSPWYIIDNYRVKLRYPDGHWSDWQYAQTGNWAVTKAGTYGIYGEAHVDWDLSYRHDYWMISNIVNFTTVDNYAPLVPQNAQVSAPLNSNPVLTWSASNVQDISGYRVYKKYSDSYGTVIFNGSVFTTNTSYTDDGFVENHKTGVDQAEYWIKAEDINNNSSGETSHFNLTGTSWAQQKIAYKSDPDMPAEFKLNQNYPNPFNPSTNINYSLPQAGLVNIKVFDMLGNEVAELVNEVKEKGSYGAQFRGENLSSGVYIYTIRFKNFIESRRMILMK